MVPLTFSSAPSRSAYVAEPERYFAPQPSDRGSFSLWLSAYLDLEGEHGVDWDEIRLLLEEAFRHVAPAAAIAELDRGRT